MSMTWRQRLRNAKKRMMEKLDLSEEDWQHIWDNIGDYCSESDAQLRAVYGDEKTVDELADRQSDYDFEQMTADIIEKIMKKLKYRKSKERKKKKSKKKDSEEQTTEEDQEEQVDEEVPEQEEEIVA